eukprot:TRINITY_DN159_c0_g1_i1.p1 TRINITY_DN159_c0_g1~~TRINITY_DN159_c0_g1_i1.p1  ORF type:complete len:299 (+),score=29.13 TRINITY_DN159_c0_g1_i1:52-948(+)
MGSGDGLNQLISILTDTDKLFHYKNIITHAITQPIAPILATIIYLLTIWTLRKIFRPIKDVEQKKKVASYYDNLATIHNIILTIESVFMFYGILKAIILTHIEFNGDYWQWYCDPLRMFQHSLQYENTRYWQRMYYYSKFHECFDTVLVVLRRGEVTFLALFHHSVMIHVAYWTNFPNDHSVQAAIWFPTGYNSLIHIIMYSYFAYRSMGFKMKLQTVEFIREFITRMQILQFVLILGYTIPLSPLINPQCSSDMLAWLFCVVPVFIILCFFVNFYIQQYFRERKKKLAAQELINLNK